MTGTFNAPSRHGSSFSFGGSSSSTSGYRGKGRGQPSRPALMSSGRGGYTSTGFDNRQQPTRLVSVGSTPVCANCGRVYSGECWGRNPIMCYNCRQPSHIVRDCPLRRGILEKSQAMG
ncbi:uncharacterized protein LOC126668375 [Mercurialis annua]|uniref:uncharacterized protein LOC126668375 n=1 Tax=Mercurialis annua TaxID=3986 RepID=UPI00215FC935|nr:uncharacterized protein LOC126668375 [Mercurialis annua]